MKKILLSSVLLVSMVQAEFSDFESQQLAVGAQVGVFGVGLNIKDKMSDTIGVRAGFDMFSISGMDMGDDKVDYDVDASIQNYSLLVDWHPWKGSFRTSAGLVLNNSKIDGVITPSKNLDFEIQGHKFEAKDVGSIDTLVDFDSIAPYIGIGGDTLFNKKQGFGFTYDLGIIFQGSAKIGYTPHFTDSAPQAIKDDLTERLEVEKKSLQDDLDNYKILPYVSIGFNYKF